MDNLIYLLIPIVGTLFILFFIEKKRTKSQFEDYNNLLNDNIAEVSNLADSAAKQNDKFSGELEQVSSDAEKAYDKLENLIYSARSQIDETQKEINDSLKEYTEDKVNQSFSDMNARLLTLAKVLEQINAENKELKKKIEFFSEIESDSKQLNETENTDAREALIQQALQEISKPKDYSERERNEKENIDVVVKDEEKPFKDILRGAFATQELVEEFNKEPFASEQGILDEEQNQAFSIMENSHKNMFITGKAGTGKSFLLEIFERATQKETIKLAPTGIAALNIGGVTLHSTFGFFNLENLHVEDISNSTLRIKSSKKMILRNIETIIIDEISMVRADTFDKIDKILRIINENDKPFGGKQMLLFGDLFQLPPIARKEEIKFLTDRYGGVYFFQSDAYKKADFTFIELSLNHRQKDDTFFYEVLNRIREGKTTNHDITALNERVVKSSEDLRRVLTLFPKKADAEMVNREELKKIEAKEYSYDAKIIFNNKNQQTPNLDNRFPIMNVLKLKRGALVMLVANDPIGRWVNGTLGIVSSLQDDEIKVSIDGRVYDVTPVTFTEQEAVYKNGRINYEDVLRVEQFPVVLAYAITIHKSQGMTYKRVACDITTCFTSGQAYVALSRCSSLEGLHLLGEVSYDITRVDNLVKEFYLNQGKLSDAMTN